MNPIFKGLLTGMILQMAIGPVFLLVSAITVDSSYLNALFAVMAVTLADYIYIFLSLCGISLFLKKRKNQKIPAVVSSVILVLFGLLFVYKGMLPVSAGHSSAVFNWTPLKSFSSGFMLTLSSPLTVLFWGSIFSAKAAELHYTRNQLVFFAAGAGFATFLFLSFTMLILSIFKTSIPYKIIHLLNCLVGAALLYYGIMRFLKR